MSFSPCHVMMVVDGDKGKDKDREGQYPIMGICVAPCGPTKKNRPNAWNYRTIFVSLPPIYQLRGSHHVISNVQRV
ncbi:hypothetical protein HMPREF0654_04460 [Prevotella disiens DNF00882]|uniref:Uncharacterized protein n=1 Tax=Prevotella disiens DNF00882 TaxID=1401075 RepID=A0A096C3W4_9BACT|nr:hypothetical protein HMPREF0654_04460 [Prevotella disiens DNF00882]